MADTYICVPLFMNTELTATVAKTFKNGFVQLKSKVATHKKTTRQVFNYCVLMYCHMLTYSTFLYINLGENAPLSLYGSYP